MARSVDHPHVFKGRWAVAVAAVLALLPAAFEPSNSAFAQAGSPSGARVPRSIPRAPDLDVGTPAAASLTTKERRWLNSSWPQIWRDDFNGRSLSPRWQHCYPWKTCTNQTNNEYQWYQPSNAKVSRGVLNLTARRERVTREVTPGVVRTFPYTSAMVQSSQAFAAAEGRVVVRARSAAGQAIWPALWLLPLDGSWPPEIDFFEQFGDPTHFEQILHVQKGVKAQFNHDGFDTTAGFHTYGVQWNRDIVVMTVDGRVTGVSRASRPDKPLYLLMNLAVGGNWVGAPTSATPNRATFQIDSVIAYGPDATANVLAPVSRCSRSRARLASQQRQSSHPDQCRPHKRRPRDS